MNDPTPRLQGIAWLGQSSLCGRAGLVMKQPIWVFRLTDFGSRAQPASAAATQ